MKVSPLQLEHQQFLCLEVTTEPDYSGEQDEWSYPDFRNAIFKTDVAVAMPENDDGPLERYLIKLKLSAHPKESGSFPYQFSVEVEGFFYVMKGVELPEGMVLVNGTSLLYSAAREALMTTTARFRYGPVLLPTVNFLDMKDKGKGCSDK